VGHVVRKCGILFKKKIKTKTQHLLSEIAIMKSVAIDTTVNHILKELPDCSPEQLHSLSLLHLRTARLFSRATALPIPFTLTMASVNNISSILHLYTVV